MPFSYSFIAFLYSIVICSSLDPLEITTPCNGNFLLLWLFIEEVTQMQGVSDGCFDLSTVKENVIVSVENALVTHTDIIPQDLVIRTDNGSH
jgi:hypothetical protein